LPVGEGPAGVAAALLRTVDAGGGSAGGARASGWPHLAQKRAASALSAPHFEQNMNASPGARHPLASGPGR
jgi:hypothetical protein